MVFERKVPFVIGVRRDGGLFAEAVGFPLYAEGDRLGELRSRVMILVRNHFGRERPVELLVGSGGSRPPAERPW